ncbi:MAG TPA: DUF2079 domain-containing protein, partial [Candidatus Sulfotelmatobacter sp.]|nr:DUF2079 domain-containing protein [Candidatus Sulfotelmatobacter sp.]
MNGPAPSLAGTLERYKELGRSLFARRDKIFFWSLLCAAAYYIVSFSLLSIAKQETFSTSAYDAGLYDQAIWLLGRGLVPFTTLKGVNIFGDHFSLGNLLLVPLFWLWNNINALYIAQTVCLALPALPLFRFAKEKLNNGWLALTVGLGYLLYPAVQNMNLENFHPETLAVLFLVLALYFWRKNNFPFYYPFLLLAVLSKEDIGLTAAALGLCLLFDHATRRHGLATVAIGLGWYLTATRLLMPLFNGVNIFAAQPVAYSYWFRALAQNWANPNYYYAKLLEPATLRYLIDLFLPLLFLPLFSPAFILMALPALGLNILSGNDYLRSVHFHYNYAVSGLLFFGLIEGL